MGCVEGSTLVVTTQGQAVKVAQVTVFGPKTSLGLISTAHVNDLFSHCDDAFHISVMSRSGVVWY